MSKETTEKRAIFFVADACPTDKERAAAAALGDPFMFRNSNYVAEDATPEPCLYAAGKVPKAYAGLTREALGLVKPVAKQAPKADAKTVPAAVEAPAVADVEAAWDEAAPKV